HRAGLFAIPIFIATCSLNIKFIVLDDSIQIQVLFISFREYSDILGLH
ncbi:MAG: hypothetical protein ACJAX4_004320, partial [Clostridium sp.]